MKVGEAWRVGIESRPFRRMFLCFLTVMFCDVVWNGGCHLVDGWAGPCGVEVEA